MIVAWFESLPTWGAALLIVGGFTAITLFFGWIIGKITPHDARLEHNDLAGFILAVIGVVYAVLLAFVAIGVWERFQASEERAYQEAGALAMVYRDAESFPQAHQIRSALTDYTKTVIDDEWAKMANGGESDEADRELETIDREVRSIASSTPSKQNIQNQMLAAMETALDDRDMRLSESATGINGLMWGVLVAGAILTVGFTYLFGFKHTIMQQLMIGSLGLLIGLVLFLTVAMDYPFRGGISVSSEAFVRALDSFRVIGP